MPVRKDNTFKCGILDHLNRAKEETTFCDVILRSGWNEIQAHRFILTKLSEYFLLLFKYEKKLSKTEITFDQNIITEESLQSIVDYAYTGDANISRANVVDLIFAADYFGIQSLKDQCEEFLVEAQEQDEHFFTFEYLLEFIWLFCNLNLSKLFTSVCIFISKHFLSISRYRFFMYVSPYSLLKILRDEELTVCEQCIPVNEIEFELLKMVAEFISENKLSENLISELLGTIHLTEIQPEKLSQVVESFPCLQDNEIFRRVSLFWELPLGAVEDDLFTTRKYSGVWKYVKSRDKTIDIDDRITDIKVYKHTFFNGTFFSSIHKSASMSEQMFPKKFAESLHQENYKIHCVVVGFELAYKSCKVIKIGKTSYETVTPFDQIISEHILLDENEVIIKIEMYKMIDSFYWASLDFLTVKFVTNLSNVFFSDDVNDCEYLTESKCLCPKTGNGYFHSFENEDSESEEITIKYLKPVWVEFRDPIINDNSFISDSSFSSLGYMYDYNDETGPESWDRYSD